MNYHQKSRTQLDWYDPAHSYARPFLRGLPLFCSTAFDGKFHFRSVLSVCDPRRWHACAGLDSLPSNGVPGRIIRQCYQSFCDKRLLATITITLQHLLLAGMVLGAGIGLVLSGASASAAAPRSIAGPSLATGRMFGVKWGNESWSRPDVFDVGTTSAPALPACCSPVLSDLRQHMRARDEPGHRSPIMRSSQPRRRRNVMPRGRGGAASRSAGRGAHDSTR